MRTGEGRGRELCSRTQFPPVSGGYVFPPFRVWGGEAPGRSRLWFPRQAVAAMKRVADLATEELEAVLSASRKRCQALEIIVARRRAEGAAEPAKPSVTCCEHVFRTNLCPRDNGCYERVCEKCGYSD